MELADIIKLFFPASLSIQALFSKNIEKILLDKGEKLINFGDTDTNIYYIQTGLVKAIFKDEKNKKHVLWCCEEGDFVASMKSYSSGLPSHIAIEAMENCVIYSIKKNFVEEMRKKYNEVDKIYTTNIEKYLLRYENLVISLKSLNAFERYKDFESIYSQYFHRIPLGDMASFLSITQSTLSKIRSKKQT